MRARILDVVTQMPASKLSDAHLMHSSMRPPALPLVVAAVKSTNSGAGWTVAASSALRFTQSVDIAAPAVEMYTR